MSIEKCIWRLSGEQADWFGLDCGYIQEGKVADIVILDPKHFDTINNEVEEAPIEAFNNYIRLVNRNKNAVSKVLVGGEVVFENEAFVEGYGKERRYGRFLRKVDLLN